MSLRAAVEQLVGVLNRRWRWWDCDAECAWVYGVIVGWPDAVLTVFQERFQWTDEHLRLIREHNGEFRKVMCPEEPEVMTDEVERIEA